MIRQQETERGLKHWTVGALMEKDGRYLLMHKKTWPHLWDVIAGHLEEGEEPHEAVKREVIEETGLTLLEPKLIWQGEIYPDPCRRGAVVHEWFLFAGQAKGRLKPDEEEVEELKWLTKLEMAKLPMVRPAFYIFDALKFWE